MWIAPELLRAYQPIPQGTQSGDVYSFSMILYSLIFEKMPFHGDDMQGKINPIIITEKIYKSRIIINENL